MRIILQRVSKASVTVGEEIVGAIQQGVCLLIGIHRYDTLVDADELVRKVLKLRLWSEGESSWKRNLQDINGGILAVSQFTLYAVTDKGAKPDFHEAMGTEDARRMFYQIVEMFRKAYPGGLVQTGAFGQLMKVDIHNDGPVTIVLESKSNNGNKTKA